MIIHGTGKFGLEIRKWNHMQKSQKTWVGFKQFFGQCIENYRRQQTPVYKTQGWTIRSWWEMWCQDSSNSCIRIKPRSRIPRLFQNQTSMWQTRCKATISSWKNNFSICRRWCRPCRCNTILYNRRHTKIMEAVDITEGIKIIEAEEDVVLNIEEIW